MCGIVGIIGRQPAAPVLLEGLARLEYRGYDSAGVAVLGRSGLRVHKAEGRVAHLSATLPKRFAGTVGIGHTRWATHGEPSDRNAHPHTDASGRLALVHNGIIENADALRDQLPAGTELRSETDTEVLAHLIAAQDAADLEERVRMALRLVEGAYGIAVIDARQPDRIVVARNGSPVLLAIGAREMLVASDAAAVVRHTDQVVHLDDGELAVVAADGYRTSTLDGEPTAKAPETSSVSATALDLGGHPHHMHKEIHEQPEAVERALRGRVEHRFATAHLGGLELTPKDVLALRRVKVLGCGSAYYAGLYGAGLVEALARIPADAETASEHRYRNPIIEPDTLYVAVSQSGETIDTLAAVQEVQRKGGTVIGIVNTPGSTIARACGSGIFLHAGHEVSVTSTKTFTSTGVAFALLALLLGRTRDLGPAAGRRLLDGLAALPDAIRAALATEDEVAAAAKAIAGAESAFFIGRVRGFHAALEGAQKLKEVSYVHAEAYPAAELKHGPLALISPEIPTVAVVPDDELWEKNMGSLAEIRARRGPLVVVTDSDRDVAEALAVLRVPRTEPELAPLLLGVPLQLLAYHAAVHLGRDVDKPRNLAKSVTVE
ncbi:glutamine--fructose-6-phosphate transaminase (isomerizing) [Iamia sp. SCSIO 61187]|uniref:glutamine--fructose-6-phosphate transaminase (isomerizing) n=1 Tax=Iamia sp. SCSIO 61187 TaxID=2722752 RepID=UPI001C632B89|nr:glutamine--fructose-6-phosphate transaminase (isomerizing) [Iamia sp. SCSIO 61187]QYG91300.1 glutamine--fructose-6-phosphate transaminase (isomerizing) [Iamia sp. SCSIO 61187]